jgi:hypothetical protein
VAAWTLASVAAAQTPPTARPGQCFARVTIPEVAETYTEIKVVAPERTEQRAVPATYETVDVQVLMREPTTEQVVAPGVYRSFVETVQVSAERVEPVVIPATLETYMERVMVRPAYVTWKPGAGILGRAATISAAATSTGAGELLCRVEVPAQYAQVRRTRIKTPESISQRTIPAVTRQVTRQELVTPARVETRPLPAVYETRKDRRLLTPATTETVTIPEVRRTEQLRRIVEPARVEWREVLCGTNASKARLAEIQRALNARGFPTASDGVFGDQTLASMEAFQRANHLAVGYLTIETVSALGVSPN